MAARSNAITELTRFWLEARHQCLVRESLPVPVYRGFSDIDLLAIRGDMKPFRLSSESSIEIGPRLIVETKDEHDYDHYGKEFAKRFVADIATMADNQFIPKTNPATPCCFTMLREEHYLKAKEFFGSEDFDRLLVLHALDRTSVNWPTESLVAKRIHVLPITDIVRDLCQWYPTCERKAGLRHTITGDMWHLLIGYCGCKPG